MKFLELLLEKSKLIGFFIIVLGGIHLIFDKVKWQFYPLYFLVLIYLLMIIFNYINILSITPRGSKWLLGMGGFLVLSSLSLNAIFPTDSVAIPSGPFKIGTQTFELTDDNRTEAYSDSMDSPRKIKVQVWYPTDNVENLNRVKWISEGKTLTRQLAKSMHAPYFLLDHLADIDSNSYEDALISNAFESYPVVVISHGWKGFRELHTDYAEALASNAYIAISIDHTYGSQYVSFENGEEAFLNKDALPSIVSPSQFNDHANQLATTYGDDVKLVLDDLPNLKLNLDLNRIGLLGHSTGGGGDVYASTTDKRVKALLGFDAWVNPLKPETLKKGLSMPALFVRSEQWGKGPNNKALDTIIKNSDQSSFLQMDETKHVDFSMSYMISPILEHVGFIGKLGGEQSSEIQKRLILDFFNQTLKRDEPYSSEFLKAIISEYDAVNLVKGYE